MASKHLPRAAGRRQRTVYLPESIDKKLRVRAAQLDTTVSVVVAQALRHYFAADQAARKKAKNRSLSQR